MILVVLNYFVGFGMKAPNLMNGQSLNAMRSLESLWLVPQRADGNRVKIRGEWDCFRSGVEQDAADEFLSGLLGQEAQALEVMIGGAGGLFYLDSHQPAARILQDKINFLLLLGPEMEERRLRPAPSGLLDQFHGHEIFEDGAGHQTVLLQPLEIESHQIAEQAGVIEENLGRLDQPIGKIAAPGG